MAPFRSAISITRLETRAQRRAAIESMTGMTRAEAFRCMRAPCRRRATIELGSRGEMVVCAQCADRPEFSRFCVRRPVI